MSVTFCPAIRYEWVDNVCNRLTISGFKVTQSTILVLFTINQELTLNKRKNNLKISRSSYQHFSISSQSVNRVLLELNEAGVISLDKRVGRSPVIDIIIAPKAVSKFEVKKDE